MKDYLLKLKDGNLIKLECDYDFTSGCETCDYGSSYVQDFEFVFTDGIFKMHLDKMYEYAFSEGDMMKLILNNIEEVQNITQMDFVEFIKRVAKEIAGDIVEFYGLYCN